MQRKQTIPIQSASVTDAAVLQKIDMLTHVLDTTGIIATISYNLTRRFVYIHFAPDFLVSFCELRQITATAKRLNLTNPVLSFRDNLIRISL